MQHPTIPSGTIAEHLDDLLEGRIDNLASHAVTFGSGAPFDGAPLDEAIAYVRVALDARRAAGTTAPDDDQFEGEMSVRLHQALRSYPLDVLDDPSFWAYLAAGPMWFFTKWREDPSERKRDGYQDYVDGRVNHACVPLRMYLRAQAVVDGDPSLASAITRGTDFWRSHVVRVKTGSMPDLARAVAERQRDQRMTVKPLREYAKRINRRWSNQVIHVLDVDECRSLAESERKSL